MTERLSEPHEGLMLPTRVLLVEDDDPSALVAGSALRMYGCDVLRVADGAEAADRANESAFHIIFMDYHLPGLDGIAATQRIRLFERETGRAAVPIIGLTASAMRHERQACLEAGMDDVLLKPFRFEELHGLIDKWRAARG